MASSPKRASTSVPLALPRYDVFLSFRGEDTRKTFTGQLCEALKGRKIIAFKDDRPHERGSTISRKLRTAIEESRFAIIVLSHSYASSAWCLDELTKILECKKERETIMPIFYNVDQKDVRHQRGTFWEAFMKHAKDGKHDLGKVQRWKAALTTLGGISGSETTHYHSETDFIEEIVDSLYKKLVCAGCNGRVDDGFNCLGAVWHRACLLCKGCNHPFAELEFLEYENRPYHKPCYHLRTTCCKSIQDHSDSQVEYNFLMASSSQRASTTTHVASSGEYDVFLSFGGEATRQTFTCHLHRALMMKRIKVYKDDNLERRTTICSELLTAIEESRFAIIVISQDYASSRRCLEELVKICACMKERKTIIPIFYNVDPSDVKHQTGTFGEAFNKYSSKHNTERLHGWKTALTKIGGISGKTLEFNQSEAEFIKEIVDLLYDKLVCAGCNRRVDDGLNCLGAVWHRACLLCKSCSLPVEQEFWECGGCPYHKRCYELQRKVCNVCSKPIDNSDGPVEYLEHPFWRQRFCPSHVKDGTPWCSSCERLKPRDTTYYKLDDGRKLCPECKESSIINTDNIRRALCHDVRKFYKKLNVKLQKIPVRLVSRQDITDAMKQGNDGSDRQLPVIRAVCLFEERTVTSAILGRPSQLLCEAKEILIWYGLPRILTGALLAQQMMRAWLRLNSCPDMYPEVEKGMCRYFGLVWLEYSSYSYSSKKHSDFERKLCAFRKHKIELRSEAVLAAKMAVVKHGLGMTLETIRKTGKFPSVTL